MSGWIKMGVGLRRHPKVVRIMSALKADRLRVVGALHAVWCVFDEHSADGFLAGYTAAVMDEEVGWRGFSAAMVAVGWLVEGADGLVVPEYEEHNGPTAKRRAMETSRKWKSRQGGQKSASDTQKTDEQSGQVSASDADKVRNRIEKSREEITPKKKDTAHARVAPPDGVDSQVWDDWLALRKAKRAPVTATVIASATAEAEKAGMPLGDFLRVWCARGSQGLEAEWLKPHERPTVQHESSRERAARERVEQFAPGAAARRPSTAEVIDVTTRRLG